MENQVEMEEKTRLINQVLELQHTLEGKKTNNFHINLILSRAAEPLLLMHRHTDY